MAKRSIPWDKFLNGFLSDPEHARAYLEASFQDRGEADYELNIRQAIRYVVRAHGVARVAERAKVGEKSLYKSFADQSDPRLSTVLRVMHALGFGISIMPLKPDVRAGLAVARRSYKKRATGTKSPDRVSRQTKQKAVNA